MSAIHHTHRWARIAEIVRRQEKVCRLCLLRGRVTPATQTDHIVAVSRGGAPFERSNLQALCDGCHDAKTRAERGAPRKVGRDGWPV